MSTVEDNLVTPDTTILETLKIIDTHGVPFGLVHEDGVLRGTVTDGDIRRGILAGVSLSDSVAKVMNTTPITAKIDTPDVDAARLMRRAGIGHLPLIDHAGKIVDLRVLKELDPKPEGGNTVVLMVGGQGTRLHPLTHDVPKPMLEIGGRPILETIIERFVAQGFNEIYLSVNYKAEMIEKHFGDGRAFGATVSYLREDHALGTGGALSLLPQRPTSPLIVMNGDVLTKVNFNHLIKFHQNHGASATMGVSEYRFTVPFGVVETSAETLKSIAEKPEHTFFVNAGIYVIDPGVLDLIPSDSALDMPDLFQHLLDQGRPPTVFPLREYWMDVGQSHDLDQANRDYSDVFTKSED
ncbi:MAG: NTP transferase domain-containing protein [Rhodospirillaceae bacterium]|nr:NTP transferase domain-containing protein [Rhodospirillaceae bacterium]MBT5240800.1 NTP transferase domain-containing protein [Rhodospirillaceae bacterium]MBT5564730.1 NTP transferase domain-containing protein [Rhodospirillaceae bacterium]MBT6090137.1 NTP transferase domain-containing protein [Rhodospirillaceae bacterium]MBT6960666.1 NTP transferase domain-containing protein [Rhodospirillaceae bacterium]